MVTKTLRCSQTEKITDRGWGSRKNGGLAAVGGECFALHGTASAAGLFRDQGAGSVVPKTDLKLEIEPRTAGSDRAEVQRGRAFAADAR